MTFLDLSTGTLREVNSILQAAESGDYVVAHPQGAHALACGLDAAVGVRVDGPVGYYCAGMNQQATVLVDGHAGTGLAENIMSGSVTATGNAGQSAGATGHGGLDAGAGKAADRRGIWAAGVDTAVG